MGKLPNGEELTDAQMMRRPGDWPQWPMLPLKKDGAFTRSDGFGFLYGDQPKSGPVIVYVGSMFFPKDAVKVEYESAEAVVADGWRVD